MSQLLTTETLTLFKHVKKKHAARHLQSAATIITRGFGDDIEDCRTDADGHDYWIKGVQFFEWPSAPMAIVGRNMEIQITLTAEELERYNVPMREGFTLFSNGLVRKTRRAFCIPAEVVNARGSFRVLTREEAEEADQRHLAEDAEEFAGLSADNPVRLKAEEDARELAARIMLSRSYPQEFSDDEED